MGSPNRLVLCGTSRLISAEELAGAEVWSVGHTSLVGADRYYELHGLPCAEPRWDYLSLPVKDLQALGFPLRNTMCVMLAHAIWEWRFKRIDILASPLRTDAEKVEQRSSLAYIAGYAAAKGIAVTWEGGIDFSTVYMGG